MIPEAPPEQTEEGLVGWDRPGRRSVTFTGTTEHEADTYFPLLGANLAVLEPGEPNSMYHWETETEAFLVISGEALLIVEGQERPLRQRDFVHCPPKTEHVIVGAGDGPCLILAMSSRENQAFGLYGEYVANEVAAKYGASLKRPPRTEAPRMRASRKRSLRATARAGFRARPRSPSLEPANFELTRT